MRDPEDFKARLAAKLRILRHRRGLRLVDLEDHGLSIRGVQLAERGLSFPTVLTLLRLAGAYEVEPYQLLKVDKVNPNAMLVPQGGRRAKGLPASRARRRGKSR